MRDTMIRNRRKSGESVGASVDTHINDVIEPLGVSFGQHLADDEVLPDLQIVLRILQRRLAAEVQTLDVAAARHLRELDNDIRLRERRDQLVKELGAKVRGLRYTLDGLFGPRSAVTLAGIEGRIEQEPVALLQQVERVIERLGDPEEDLAIPNFGVLFDPAVAVEDFQADYEEFRGLVNELRRENRKSDATVIAKNEAVTRYDEQFRWIASCLWSLYHLAGQHELAERVKPSTRRAGRTQADVEGEASNESASDDSGDPPAADAPPANG